MKRRSMMRTLRAWLGGGWAGRARANAADAEATDRLVSAALDGAADQPSVDRAARPLSTGWRPSDRTRGNAEAPTPGDARETAKLIQAIREIGISDGTLPEPQVNAIMAGLRREAGGASRRQARRDALGMAGGFLASAATLASGLLLVGGIPSTPPLGPGAVPPPVLALAVASLAALAGLFLYRESSRHRELPHRESSRGSSPALPVVALAALATASCAPDSPDSREGDAATEIEIPATALTVFEEGDELWGVRDIIESGDAIWALTEAEPFLRAHDPGGRILADFGTSGEGPGELSNPWTLSATDPAGSVIVWDHRNRRRSIFTSAGEFVSSVPAPAVPNGAIRGDIRNVTFGNPFRVGEDRGGLFVASYGDGLSRPADFWGGRILRIGDGQAEPRTVVDFAADLPGAANRVPLMGLAPVPLWDLCPDGRIVVLDPVARSLHLHAPDGAEERRIPLAWAARALSREERLGYVRAMISGETRGTDIADEEVNAAAEGMLAQAGDQLATEAPLGVDLRCAPGRVWIQEFDGASHALGYGRGWRTVSLDGANPGAENQAPRFQRILFPEGFVPWRLTDSMAIGVMTDDLNLQRLAVVRLESAFR